MQKDSIIESVITKFRNRSEIGMEKYGTTLEQNNKDNFLKHLSEELMDATAYIEKLMNQQEQLVTLVRKHPNDSELGKEIRRIYDIH